MQSFFRVKFLLLDILHLELDQLGNHRSPKGLSVPEYSEVVGNPEGAELQDEGLEGRVGLDVESRVNDRGRRTGHVVKERLVIKAAHGLLLLTHSQVMKECRNVRLCTVLHQLDGWMCTKKLKTDWLFKFILQISCEI